MLQQYDAQTFLGGLNTSAVVREVGPLIISFLLAGKIGAFTAAELGTMRVTEQIDAIECLGTNPLQYLIVPRFIAIVLSSVLLLVIGLMISIGGAMFVANWLCGINPLQYISSIPKFTTMGTLAGGTFKCLVYGVIVAGVSCYKGYTASGGARGVGQAVTRTAIYTNLFIVIANFLTSEFIQFCQDTTSILWQRFLS
jgi:phospholipid/cholesterol/gamma-HCH transport system permease protein